MNLGPSVFHLVEIRVVVPSAERHPCRPSEWPVYVPEVLEPVVAGQKEVEVDVLRVEGRVEDVHHGNLEPQFEEPVLPEGVEVPVKADVPEPVEGVQGGRVEPDERHAHRRPQQPP